jgi:hypothetical protein
MMKRLTTACALLATVVVSTISAAEDVQWIRVTVLLETGSQSVQRAEDLLVPGGVYSLAEVARRGQDAVDREILERVKFLAESMDGVEESMRLATLLARQYYLPLEKGKKAVLPVVDLNPRLGIVFTPLRTDNDQMVFEVQFLEPDGPVGATEFSGDPISLRLQEADLQSVLGVFSKITPFTIEVDSSVSGTVTVDLRDVPWDQALDLVLRTNNLGWKKDGDILRVAPLDEMSRRKRVRTEATISLGWGSSESATIASRGDAVNPTAVVILEGIEGPPELAAERDGLVHPTKILLPRPSDEDRESFEDGLAVFRARVAEDGSLEDISVLAAPLPTFSERLEQAIDSWTFRTVLDEQGRKQEAVVGYGVRFRTQRILASISAVEHVGIDVDAAPAPNHPGQYVVTVNVTDLDTGQIISAPRIPIVAGQKAKVRSDFTAPSGNPTEFEMSVLISEGGKAISYSWRLTRDDEVLSEHKAEFEL